MAFYPAVKWLALLSSAAAVDLFNCGHYTAWTLTDYSYDILRKVCEDKSQCEWEDGYFGGYCVLSRKPGIMACNGLSDKDGSCFPPWFTPSYDPNPYVDTSFGECLKSSDKCGRDRTLVMNIHFPHMKVCWGGSADTCKLVEEGARLELVEWRECDADDCRGKLQDIMSREFDWETEPINLNNLR